MQSDLSQTQSSLVRLTANIHKLWRGEAIKLADSLEELDDQTDQDAAKINSTSSASVAPQMVVAPVPELTEPADQSSQAIPEVAEDQDQDTSVGSPIMPITQTDAVTQTQALSDPLAKLATDEQIADAVPNQSTDLITQTGSSAAAADSPSPLDVLDSILDKAQNEAETARQAREEQEKKLLAEKEQQRLLAEQQQIAEQLAMIEQSHLSPQYLSKLEQDKAQADAAAKQAAQLQGMQIHQLGHTKIEVSEE